MTFVTVEKNLVNGEFDVHIARVILDPRNDDGSSAPIESEFCTHEMVLYPNYRNQGNFNMLQFNESGRLQFKMSSGNIAAAGIIVSRKNGSLWMRSDCKLVINENVIGESLCSLGDAVDSSLNTAAIYTDSDEYLNNAGVGGPQGTSGRNDDTQEMQLSNMATINGVQQDISGGSTSIISPLREIVLRGIHINPQLIVLKKKNDAQAEPIPFAGATGGNTATMNTEISVASDTTYQIIVNSTPICDITVYVDGGME